MTTTTPSAETDHDQPLHGDASATQARAAARSAALEVQLDEDPSRFRVLTGDRPTGRLHLGHYFGSLANRVRLQDAGVDSFLVVADYQVIYDRHGVGELRENVLHALADYLASGIDPQRTTIFAHSAVTALNQLLLPFLSLVTDSELRRNPTVKEEFEAATGPMSGLMLTFPVHQAADILFCKANLVPVGRDQLPHIELTRLIARRFDERYGRPKGAKVPVFPEADALLTQTSNLLGTDGTKMSKSKGNTIEIGFSADETAAKLKRAKTDADRTITYDPEGRPEVSNLVLLGALAAGRDPEEVANEIGESGAGALKKFVTEAVNERFAPIRERRAELAADPGYLLSVLREGNERAIAVAEATLAEVRESMQMDY